MAWGYRNRRRYYRRRYYRRGYGRGASRRAFGNMRAAKQQADNATFTINVPSKFSSFMKKGVQLPGLATGDLQTTGVFPISIYELLRQSEFFNNYANMYDEFKIDKIKVKLLPTSFTINTNGNYRNLTIYTAWDRTGLNTTQIHTFLDKAHPQNNQVYCTIGEDITTYSSAESRTVNPNTNTSITRWLNPKTITEKSQWLSTSLLKQWYTSYDPANGCFTGIQFDGDDSQVARLQTATNDWNSIIKYSNMAKDNPCFLLEDPAIKFKPTLLVGVFPAVDAASFDTNTNLIHFNVETEIVCTYRGLRKGKVLGNTAQGQVQPSKIGPKPAVIEADGTYTAASDGLDGYSSVVVRVGEGETPQLEDNNLRVLLNNEAILAAKQRNDQVDGTSLKDIIEWPKTGQIDWSLIYQTQPNLNAKWVDVVGINVSNVVLPSEYSQRSELLLGNVETDYANYRPGQTQPTDDQVVNSTYPNDFKFTENSQIYYKNITPSGIDQHALVELHNNVHCIEKLYGVGDIGASKDGMSEQDQIQRNSNINPNGYFLEGRFDEGTQATWVHFRVDLPDGMHQKILNPGTDMAETIEIPKLYANKIQGYFKLPSLQANAVIDRPGRWAIGNFVGGQDVFELQYLGDVNANLQRSTFTRANGDTDPEFTLGTFTVDIDTGISIPKITGFKSYQKYGSEQGTFIDALDEEFFNHKLDANGTKTVSFNYYYDPDFMEDEIGGEDAGIWLIVYKCGNTYGAWPFQIDSNETHDMTYELRVSNFGNNVPLYYTIIKAKRNISGQNYDQLQTYGFCDEEGNIVLPLVINTKTTLPYNSIDWINGGNNMKYINFHPYKTFQLDSSNICSGNTITINNQNKYINSLVQYDYNSDLFALEIPDPSGEDEDPDSSYESNLSKSKTPQRVRSKK